MQHGRSSFICVFEAELDLGKTLISSDLIEATSNESNGSSSSDHRGLLRHNLKRLEQRGWLPNTDRAFQTQ